jgi:hypothetical protein
MACQFEVGGGGATTSGGFSAVPCITLSGHFVPSKNFPATAVCQQHKKEMNSSECWLEIYKQPRDDPDTSAKACFIK